MEEESSEEEEAEESVAEKSGGESLDDPAADGDSLGERSIASVPGTVLSDTSLPVTSLMLSTQAAQPAATKSRRRTSSSSSQSARSASRSILNQSGAEDDEDFEQEAYTSRQLSANQRSAARGHLLGHPPGVLPVTSARRRRREERTSPLRSTWHPYKVTYYTNQSSMPSRFIVSVRFHPSLSMTTDDVFY